MEKQKFFLTQRQIRSILDAYSCRNDEFVDFGENEDHSRISYRSCVLKGFVIVIEQGIVAIFMCVYLRRRDAGLLRMSGNYQ